MRTKKSTVFLVVSLLLLCCHVEQCQQLALGTMFVHALANSMSAAASSVMATTAALGMNALQSFFQGFVSTVHLGFSNLHTMTLSLFSGFLMGNLALAGFILFLLALVPAEEEKRSLGGNSLFTPLIQYHHTRNHTDYRGIPLVPYTSSPSTNNSLLLHRDKRALVNNFTLPEHLAQELNSTERIPRFLTRLVQQDPLNCLPLIMCGLSASSKPSERTEVLNDYAYLLKEFLRPGDDSPEDDESAEDDLSDENASNKKKKGNKDNRLRSPLKLLNKLVQGGFTGKKKDEVDKLIDEMRKSEDDQLEELALTEMAEDPSDLKYALEDMKVKGLTKTMSKMPAKSKKQYISKLMGDESLEEEDEGEMVEDEEDPDVRKAMMGRYEPPKHHMPAQDEDSGSFEGYPHGPGRPYPMYFDPKELTRGAFQPPPPTPPLPDYGEREDQLYKRNVAMLERNLDAMPGGFMTRRILPLSMARHHSRPPGPPPPHMNGRRRGREGKDVKHTAHQRAFIQKKRGEAAKADNVYDKSRVAAEVGQVTRSNRQCRALFNECPVASIARPVVEAAEETDRAPFLNRAVNNIRRVLLGSPAGESTKTKRVNEIKQAIQELNPPARSASGASEVKVVLNIGPSGQPHIDLHRGGGIPAAGSVYPGHQQYGNPQPPQYQSPMPQQNMPSYPHYMGMHPQMGMHSHEMMSPQMGMHSHEMMSPQMGMPPHMMDLGPVMIQGMPYPSNMHLPPKSSPTGFSTQLKYTASRRPATLTTKRPQMTAPIHGTTKKSMVYKNVGSSPGSKKSATQSSVNLDDLEQYLKTTTPTTDSQEATSDYPVEETTVVSVNTFSDIVASMEQDEPSVEEDIIVVPTKYPTKDHYAQNLRETFQIFDRFKEAHKQPPLITIARATAKTPTTTRKPGIQVTGNKKGEPSKRKPSVGDKGEQADIELGDHNDDDGKGDDLGSILTWFKKFANRVRPNKKGHKKKGKKGKKGKGKKKGKPEESSEESSEEHYDHGPLVAVPPPHVRKQIHWRSGTTLVKDGVYHLLFGKRVTRPIPPLPGHHHHHTEKKPTKHDVQYHSHEHHPPPHHDNSKGEGEDAGFFEDTHGGQEFVPSYFHRMRTSESVEDDIPPPPPLQDEVVIPKKKPKPVTSKESSKPSSSAAQKTVTQSLSKKKKKLKAPKPIPKPDPPMSYEDLASDEDDDDGLPPIPKLPPPPPHMLIRKKPGPVDSRSIESSYEEDEEETDDDGFNVEPTKPKMVFSPFSIVRNGNKFKLKSATFSMDTDDDHKANKKGENKNGNGSNGKYLLKRTSGSKNNAMKSKNTVMTKASAISTTTVQPKRKILKYKNG